MENWHLLILEHFEMDAWHCLAISVPVCSIDQMVLLKKRPVHTLYGRFGCRTIC